MLAPVREVYLVGAYLAACGGRMHESAVPEVDADVGGFLSFLVEEHQIAFGKIIHIELDTGITQRIRVARKRDPDLAEAVMNQAAAIEAVWIDPAVAIRCADHRQREIGGAARISIAGAYCSGCRCHSRRRAGAGCKREYDAQH